MWKLSASNLSDIPNLSHGFFGRRDGVSSGLYDSLNCGPGSADNRGDVIENRRRVLLALTKQDCRLVTPYQIHSAEAVIVREPWEIGAAPKADALATDISGLALGIVTADCAPVLLADAQAHVIGAAHAGWKGALAGVIEQAIARMEQLGAQRDRIAAAIGPCIAQPAYEVGEEFRAVFIGHAATHARFFVPAARSGHWQFDLPAFAQNRLQMAGVQNVAVLAECTYTQPENFFSFRRATHRGESDYGRQLSTIVLP
ncbi:MAG TPA: peptidoglycan editing factor PgeF [Rhizomicrobium sp.]|jgi:hypothetical protein